jgi:hypothetical protein
MQHRILALGLILTAFGLVSTEMRPAEAQAVRDGLVSYFSFDQASIQGNVAQDGLGTHAGEIQGKLQLVKGRVGEALSFDGVPAKLQQGLYLDGVDQDLLERRNFG